MYTICSFIGVKYFNTPNTQNVNIVTDKHMWTQMEKVGTKKPEQTIKAIKVSSNENSSYENEIKIKLKK